MRHNNIIFDYFLQNVDSDVKELEHLKHVDKTKEMILPDLQKQLEEEAISSELNEQEFEQQNVKQMNVKAEENLKVIKDFRYDRYGTIHFFPS